jgi:hypothetical protein
MTQLDADLAAERFGGIIREAHSALAGAKPWTAVEQALHRDELLAAVDGREDVWDGTQ